MLEKIIAFALLLPGFFFGQHSIKGTFSPAGEYKIALLYKVGPTVSNYVANARIEADGSFEFKMDSTATKGMYRLVYAIPQEEYNFDIIYDGNEDVELAFNSETGVEFLSSRENKLLESYTNSMLMITNSIGNYYRDQDKNKDTLALAAIFETQRETQQGFEEASEGTIASHFIKANRPFVPGKALGVQPYVSKLEAHYFDHVDFNDQVLQCSEFLTERMLNYVFGMAASNGDEVATYKNNIQVFCEAMKDAPSEIKKSLLTDLWEQMVDLKQETVANFIAEDYLMDLSVALNDQELLHALVLFKELSLGSVAPDFSFEIMEREKAITKKLSALNDAQQYILVFWSSNCPHCLDEVPQLHKFAEAFDKGRLKVIAIALENELEDWKKLTLDLPGFLHVYGKGKWENKIGDAYGVTATPTYFVLDKNKKIVAKPKSIEALRMFFENEK